MKTKKAVFKKERPKDKLKSAKGKDAVETQIKQKSDIYRLLNNENFLRALKEKLETV